MLNATYTIQADSKPTIYVVTNKLKINAQIYDET